MNPRGSFQGEEETYQMALRCGVQTHAAVKERGRDSDTD